MPQLALCLELLFAYKTTLAGYDVQYLHQQICWLLQEQVGQCYIGCGPLPFMSSVSMLFYYISYDSLCLFFHSVNHQRPY